MYNNKIRLRAKNILSISCEELSTLGKIYMIYIVKTTLDLLNDLVVDGDGDGGGDGNGDENENELNQLINELEILHDKFEKYYIPDSDFYFNDYSATIKKSFLTYICEKNNKYYSISDIKIKCFVLEDFIASYPHSKFKKINEKNKLIKLNKIKLIYNNWELMLNEI